MRKLTLAVLLAGLVLGCDNKAPSGPSSVTVQTPTTTTTAGPTTRRRRHHHHDEVAPPATTTMPLVTSRMYISFGQVGPTIPVS